MNKHILVQDIRRDAEQSIQLSRDQILKIMGRKKLISSAPEVRAKRDKVLDFFADYQMALYMYAFSSFLEVLLLGNYAADYLESVAGRIRELELSYRELYTDCYNTLENMSKKSVETYLAKGVAGVSKGAGKVIGKIPGIQKGPVDEALIASGEWIQDRNDDKAGHQLRSFAGIAEDYTVPFVNSVEELKKLYNQPQEIYVINDSLYLVTAAG